jgi:alpha-glucosidase
VIRAIASRAFTLLKETMPMQLRAVRLPLAVILLMPAAAWAQSWTVTSPSSRIALTVTRASTGSLSYTATSGGAVVLEGGALGINTSIAEFSTGLVFSSRGDAVISETYSLPGHKQSTYVNRANEMVLRFTRSGQEIDLVGRAYDDGVAFRYRVPGTGDIRITSEGTIMNLRNDATGWSQTYRSNYEGFYDPRTSFASGSFGFPLLARSADQWVLLAESDIGGSYHASHLDGGANNNLRVAWPTTTAVTATRPFNSPWRMAVIGTLATIVGSTMVENLSTPSQISDTSWIGPGRAAWSWRAGGVQSDFNTHPPYVDLAASLGWETYLVDEGWQASWVPSLISYASARNVGIWLWVNSADVSTEARARASLSQWASWGVKGVKVDFFNGDSQTTMQLYDMLGRVAAENRLSLNFHGATKPNGLERKWPNIVTREAVFGAEQGSLSAAHNLSLVFTRNAIGPMDYTPVVYSNANGVTTWGHQTALSIVFSSYLQHFSDHWAMYRDSIARALFRVVPTTWDETRLIDGDPAQFATIARRKGAEWYIGTIANGARTATIPLSFLNPNTAYTAHIFSDGTSRADIAYQRVAVTNASTLSIPILAAGGAAIRITADPTPMTTATYVKIVSRSSGKVLTVQNAAITDTAAVIQWPFADATTNDEWRTVDVGGGFVSIVNRNSGRALDISGASTAAGASLIQLADHGRTNQQWQLVDAGGGFSRIVSRSTGMDVDVKGASTADGAAIIQWPANGGANQQWQFVPVATIP